MEETQNLITFIVIASTSTVLLVLVVLIDFVVLLRKRKKIAAQEIELRDKKIDEILMKQEVQSVNALLKGQNSERRRISQELHDRLGSILFTAKLYHSNIEKKIKEIQQDQREGMDKLTGLLDDAVQEVRRISHDLYAGSLANFGYTVALKQLIGALAEANAVEISFSSEGDVDQMDEELQQDLYAITQELLSNTLKHAKASNVDIQARANGDLEFHYRDDGKGFDQESQSSGIGLKNIASRVEKHNGKLEVETSPENGTYYSITIPRK